MMNLLNVKAFEAILVNKVDDILDESSAVLGRADVGGEMSASSPTTD
jgi:hypothetical protein